MQISNCSNIDSGCINESVKYVVLVQSFVVWRDRLVGNVMILFRDLGLIFP